MDNSASKKPLTFQQIIQTLNNYWSEIGCVIGQPYGMEVGAGTANPHTFFRALGPEPYNVAYVEPSRRPDDGRYGENPNRLQHYYQYQIILKPAPENNIQLYIESLKRIGIDPKVHDLRFVEDNWASAPLGAWGLGWEVWLDGMEISQYTYFQQFAGLDLPQPCIEITLGLERLAMFIQGVDDYRKIMWNDHLTYGDIFEKHEYLQSKFNFETADVPTLQTMYDGAEKLARDQILNQKNYWAGYDNLLRMSHYFNLLDARGVVSLSDRTAKFKNMGFLSREVGKLYVEDRENQNYPFMNKVVLNESAQSTEKVFSAPTNDENLYILELGFEEFPANYLKDWVKSLGENYAETYFRSINGFTFDSAKLLFTPQRIVLEMKNPAREIIKQKVAQGPLKDICEKNPEVLQKFIEKNSNGNEYTVDYESRNGKDVVVLKVNEKYTLNQIIQEFINSLITNAPVAKSMHWNSNKSDEFIRPLRWIFSYLSNQLIPVEAFGVKAKNYTYSPRYDEPIKAVLNSASDYREFINSYGIILDQNQRKALIENETKDDNYTNSENIDKYVELNTYLTERPIVKWIELDSKYNVLPVELITAVLESHQKYLVKQDKVSGKIYYGIVYNGYEVTEAVIHGNEKVATARLEDGLFYYNLDLQEGYPNREALKKVVWIPGLKIENVPDEVQDKESYQEYFRTYYAKATRLEILADRMYFELYAKRDEIFTQSLKLVKNVKAAHIVKEFPDLEAVMSEYLAKKTLSGVPDAVTNILREHYLPTSSESKMPRYSESQLLSLADKIDTLTALTITGDLPQGSNDPYEARKNAYGLLKLAKDGNYGPLDRFFEIAFRLYGADWNNDNELRTKLLEFINTRLYQSFKDESDKDVVCKGVAFAKNTSYGFKYSFFAKLSQLAEQDPKALERITDTFKRVGNILRKADVKLEELNTHYPELFEYEAERELEAFMSGKRIKGILLSVEDINELAIKLEKYFTDVIVMSPDENKKNNRLAVLKELKEIIENVFWME